jgi:hypothetical protein
MFLFDMRGEEIRISYGSFARGELTITSAVLAGMLVVKGIEIMDRQCAWCLRNIDNMGERISLLPLPKRYDATHGICIVCGTRWMEQALRAYDAPILLAEDEQNAEAAEFAVTTPSRSVIERIMRLQTTG